VAHYSVCVCVCVLGKLCSGMSYSAVGSSMLMNEQHTLNRLSSNIKPSYLLIG
jgi:hypothetical protein